MNEQTPQAIHEQPQIQQNSPPSQPQHISPPVTTPSASSNLIAPLQSPEVLQVTGPGQHQHVPSPTATLSPTGQYVAPLQFPQSYQQGPGQQPTHFQDAPTTIPGTTVNQSFNGHYMQQETTISNMNSPTLPAIMHHPNYQQHPTHIQPPTGSLPQNFPGNGINNSGFIPTQGLFTAQPGPAKGMEYTEKSEEELKKQRRAEKIAKARHCAGQACLITGKMCIVAASVMAAACSVVSCLVGCLPGDSPGIMGGGGGGIDMGFPT